MIRRLAFVVFLSLTLIQCKSQDTGLLDATYVRLVDASEILEDNRGDQQAAESALMKLYQTQHEQILLYRSTADSLVASLSKEEQDTYRKRMQEIRAKLENLSRTYDKPLEIVRILALMY
ncbi:MAG: hypothetical protein HUU55_18070 [Myxococcales bacterium]|nr:hypothetical protein [Myxococcales bacterium]